MTNTARPEEKIFAEAMNDLVRVAANPMHRARETSVWNVIGLSSCSPAGLEKLAPIRPLIAEAAKRGLIPSPYRNHEPQPRAC